MSTRVVPEEMLDPCDPVDESAPASVRVRAQSAVVRTLAHALEQLALSSDAAAALRAQLEEERVRLGSCVEQDAAMDGVREQE